MHEYDFKLSMFVTLHDAHSHLYMYIYTSCSVSKDRIVYCVYSLKSKIKILKL